MGAEQNHLWPVMRYAPHSSRGSYKRPACSKERTTNWFVVNNQNLPATLQVFLPFRCNRELRNLPDWNPYVFQQERRNPHGGAAQERLQLQRVDCRIAQIVVVR